MFKKDDYCLYNYDVCKVIDIKNINGRDYYVLTPVKDNTLTIKVPVSNENNNVRKLLTHDEVNNLINKMKDIELIDVDKNYLESEYKRLLNTGNREDLVKIIKTTYIRNKKRSDLGKKIGEKDDAYFHLAEKSLYNEIAIVLGMSFDETKEYIINRLK